MVALLPQISKSTFLPSGLRLSKNVDASLSEKIALFQILAHTVLHGNDIAFCALKAFAHVFQMDKLNLVHTA